MTRTKLLFLPQEFAQELERRSRRVHSLQEPCWGTHHPLHVLNDSGSVSLQDAAFPLANVSRDSRRLEKLTSPVAEGLANYGTAYLLFDIIVRQRGKLGVEAIPVVNQGSHCDWVGQKNLVCSSRSRYR